MILPIKVGDTITIDEADRYCGSGDVTLRVTSLPAEHLPSGSDWIQLTGVEITCDGHEVGEQTTLIRAAALRAPS
jgi:hypothetical protein